MKKTLRIWQAHRIFSYSVITAVILLWYLQEIKAFNAIIVLLIQIAILLYVNTQIMEVKQIIKYQDDETKIN